MNEECDVCGEIIEGVNYTASAYICDDCLDKMRKEKDGS